MTDRSADRSTDHLTADLNDHREVIWSQAALKTLQKLDKTNRGRIVKAAQLLSANPHPPAARRVTDSGRISGTKGSAGLFRIRTGDWRLLYAVQDRELIVLIVKVGHRSEVYNHP